MFASYVVNYKPFIPHLDTALTSLSYTSTQKTLLNTKVWYIGKSLTTEIFKYVGFLLFYSPLTTFNILYKQTSSLSLLSSLKNERYFIFPHWGVVRCGWQYEWHSDNPESKHSRYRGEKRQWLVFSGYKYKDGQAFRIYFFRDHLSQSISKFLL